MVEKKYENGWADHSCALNAVRYENVNYELILKRTESYLIRLKKGKL